MSCMFRSLRPDYCPQNHNPMKFLSIIALLNVLSIDISFWGHSLFKVIREVTHFLCTDCVYHPFIHVFVIYAVYMQKKHSKSMKRKTRQAKALENARKAPRTFIELLHEVELYKHEPCVLFPFESASIVFPHCFYKIGKFGIFAAPCSFLLEGCSRTSKLYFPPPFLHCLWFFRQLYLCEVRDTLLFMPLPKYT